MTRTIYIRKEDVPVWERARQMALGGQLGPVIMELLKQYVAVREKDLAHHPLGCRCQVCASNG